MSYRVIHSYQHLRLITVDSVVEEEVVAHAGRVDNFFHWIVLLRVDVVVAFAVGHCGCVGGGGASSPSYP